MEHLTPDLATRFRQSRWKVTAPLAFMVAIQIGSGIPHPSYFTDLGRDDGFSASTSRLLFAVGDFGANLLHVPLFTLLALLWCWALPSWFRTTRSAVVAALLICFTFAVGNEWTQIFVPRRWATWGDVLSNLVGVLIGLFLYVAIGAAARRTDDA